MPPDELDPEYTGPPLGDPPEHVHENSGVADAVDAATDEVDELLEAVQTLQTQSAENQATILGRIEACLTSLNQLSTQTNATETPMLVQLVAQVTALQTEVAQLRVQLADSLTRNQSSSESPISSESLPSDSQNPDNLTDEEPESDAENIPPERAPRKRQFR